MRCFLNKLKPDGGGFCSQPCLQFSPANSLKSQPPMSGACSPRRSLTAGMQIASWVGISESETEEGAKEASWGRGFLECRVIYLWSPDF